MCGVEFLVEGTAAVIKIFQRFLFFAGECEWPPPPPLGLLRFLILFRVSSSSS